MNAATKSPLFSARVARPLAGTGRGAFTLIELLVVIAVILILAALILPIASKGVRQARGAQCISNLRQIGAAMMSYLKDSKMRFQVSWDQMDPDQSKRRDWTTVLLPYVPNYEIFSCPSRKPWYTEAGNPQRGITFPLNYGICTAIQGKIYTSIQSPSQLGIIADAGHDRFYNNETTYGVPQVRQCAVHSDKAGVLFADMHQVLVKKEDVTPAMFTP